ncbi:MAG: DotI/IcmL/TraM family protein [Actinomycetaceae bacterium]|nr:DotI/IcmL/TraM family protein [Actinomycetaceae bacterium]
MEQKPQDQRTSNFEKEAPQVQPIGVGDEPSLTEEAVQDALGDKDKGGNTSKSGERSQKASKEPSEAKKMQAYYEALEKQLGGSASGGLIREYARLQLDYANQKKRASLALIAALFMTICLGISAWSVLFVFPKYRYIPVSNAGAICEIAAEDSPRVTPTIVIDWAKNTALASYTYDYVNWREILEQVGNTWYTEKGKKAFRNSLTSSRNLDRVIEGRYIIRAAVIRNPIIVESNPDSWVVDVPIAIEFHTGAQTHEINRQTFAARVKVVRVPASSTNLRGIATENLSLAPFTAGR